MDPRPLPDPSSRLGRPARGYVRALDGLRAFAVLLVIASHAGVPHATGGKSGVLVFFVLSGYLITGILLRERERERSTALGAFYFRRVLRLVPALVVATAAYAVAAVFIIPDTPLGRQTIGALPAALFYFLNWWHIGSGYAGFFGHYWSLSVEEQFYLVWPIVLILTHRRWGAKGVMWAALVGAATSYLEKLVLAAGATRQTGTDFAADALLVGCAVAAAIVVYRRSPARWLGPAAVAGCAAIAASLVFGNSTGLATPLDDRLFAVVWWPASVLGAVALISAIALGALPRWIERILDSAPAVALGRISYAMYLWHILMLWIFGRLIPVHGITRLALALLATIAVSAVSYRFVEAPFLRIKRRFERGADAPAAMSTTDGAGVRHDSHPDHATGGQRA